MISKSLFGNPKNDNWKFELRFKFKAWDLNILNYQMQFNYKVLIFFNVSFNIYLLKSEWMKLSGLFLPPIQILQTWFQ